MIKPWSLGAVMRTVLLSMLTACAGQGTLVDPALARHQRPVIPVVVVGSLTGYTDGGLQRLAASCAQPPFESSPQQAWKGWQLRFGLATYHLPRPKTRVTATLERHAERAGFDWMWVAAADSEPEAGLCYAFTNLARRVASSTAHRAGQSAG